MKRQPAALLIRTTLLCLALALPAVASAQMPLSDCAGIPGLAANIMLDRHRNADIMLMINKMNAELSDQGDLLTWANAMIDMAWAQPIAAGPEAQAQRIAEFQTLWLQRCESRRPGATPQ
jgi:hypothetical protein